MSDDYEECEDPQVKPRSLTLTAMCNECGVKLRMVTDDSPAMEIMDFLAVDDESGFEKFRWEHDE